MALQKVTVSTNLGQSLDQHDDPKAGGDQPAHQLAENVVHNRLKRLDKRCGTASLATTVMDSGFSITTPLEAQSVLSHNDQLLAQNNAVVYSYSPSLQSWKVRGYHKPVSLISRKITANQSFQFNPDGVSLSGKTFIAYESVPQPISSLDVREIRYCVIEESTGSYLVNDQIVAPATNDARCPRVIKFANALFIAWAEGTNSDLKIAQISVSDGHILGAAQTLKSDLRGKYFNFVMTPAASLLGESCLFIYSNNVFTASLFAIDQTSALKTSFGTKTIGLNGPLIPAIYISSQISPNKLFFAYAAKFNGSDPGGVFVSSYTFDATTLTAVFADVRVHSVPEDPMQRIYGEKYQIKHLTLCENPVTHTEVFVFFDTNDFNYIGRTDQGNNGGFTIGLTKGTLVYRPNVYFSKLNLAGTVLINSSLFKANVFLSAKALVDAQKIYLATSVDTTEQATDFVFDFLANATVAKFNYGLSRGQTEGNSLSQFSLNSRSEYFYAHGFKARRSTDRPFDPLTAIQTGISQNILNLHSTDQPAHVFLNHSSFLTGGILSEYDSAQVFENNFLIAPELVDIQPAGLPLRIHVRSNIDFDIVVLTNGSGIYWSAENYFRLYSNTTNYIFWFYFPEFNSTPPTGAGAGTLIPITLTTTDTAYDITCKIQKAILNMGGFNFRPTLIGGTLAGPAIYLNVQIVSITPTAPPSTASLLPLSGGLVTGTYNYIVIWTWTDQKGKLHKSTTSTPTPVAITQDNISAGIVAFYPPITNKPGKVKIEIFRTLLNGKTFYKLQGFYFDESWDPSGTFGFYDNYADTQIKANEPLYTTGDVQDNVGLGASFALTAYKNRLFTVQQDDPTSVYYSKTISEGIPVEFTPFNFITINNDEDPITALAVLDDKLLIFKKKRTYYLAGDGANDLGANSTFSDPVLIATDVGAISQNSVVTGPFGVVFQSEKGIFVIDRSLTTQFIGLSVIDYKDNLISRAICLEDENQIRFVFSDLDECLVFDYKFGKWTSFTPYGGQDACIWQKNFTRITATGAVRVENKTAFTDQGALVPSFNQRIRTKWLHVKDVQDFARAYRLSLLGELKSAHTLNFKVWYDYDDTNFDTYTFASSLVTDGVYQPQIHLRHQKCEALKLELEVLPLGGSEEALTLTDLTFEVGLKQGLYKVGKAKRI